MDTLFVIYATIYGMVYYFDIIAFSVLRLNIVVTKESKDTI